MSLFPRVRSRLIVVSLLVLGNSLAARRSTAQDKPDALRVDHSAVNANVGGLHLCVPEKWSVLDLVVTNPTDKPREILSATYFDGAPTLQYGRRLWVPARARLTTWLPVLLPKLPPGADPRFNIHSVVLDPRQSQEVLHREAAGGVLHSGILPARVERPVTGFMRSSDVPAGQPDPAYELVIAGRSNQPDQSRRLAYFDVQSRIPDDFSQQGVDHLVISDGKIHDDLVRLAAIRRWMHAGGQLWIMLDQVDPQAVERIVGDDFRCQVVDRVGLTTVRIETKRNDRGVDAVESDHEQPVDLVRVVLAESDIQVEHTVNGWPAAFWKPCGAGQLLVTTLGARGWMRPRSQQDVIPVAPQSQTPSAFVVLTPMAETAKAFFGGSLVARTSIVDACETQAAEYVGYSIPPRWQIAGLLVGFGGAIMALGACLCRKSALEHLGWSAPALSIAAATVLLVIGGRNRHLIPPTVAIVDFVQAVSGTDDIRSRGAAAFYRP